MARQVIWSPAALEEVEQIVAFARTRSDEQARRIGASFFASVDVLISFPGIGPVFDGDPSRSVREIMCGRFRIFYHFDEEQDQIEILAVRGGSRRDPDPQQLLDRID